MRELHADLAVIGWGKGGKTLARSAGKAGRSVILVEQSAEMVGGTCINIACVPTKALVHDARERRAGDDGVEAFGAAVERRDTLTGTMRAKNFELLDTVPTVTTIRGRAVFVGPRELEVSTAEGPLRVTADAVVINTGSVPRLPDVPGAVVGGRVHDSTTLQHATPLPQRLLVVGAGPIGLEFAQLMAQFGSAVTVLDRGERILPREDPEVAEAVAGALEDAGVTFLHRCGVTRIEDGADAVRVTWDGPERSATREFDAVLLATGRRAVTEGLGLEAAGVDLDERGFVAVDEHLRTSAEGVYAIGDVNGGPQQTYISLDDYRIVADDLYGEGERTTATRGDFPTTIFTTPPVSRVGVTVAKAREQARERGLNALVASKAVADIAAMPRPKIEGDPRGLITVVVDAETDLVLGACLMHLGSDEVINLVAMAMKHGITASDLRDAVYTHPSATEALNEVLGELRPL